MTWHERVGNLHIHTTYSDGTADYDALVETAVNAGLDFVIVTDHNTFTPQHSGWHNNLLVLTGEEIHDPGRPNANHLLVFGAGVGMAVHGGDPRKLLAAVREQGGLSFIAHPFEHSGVFTREPDINWVAWDADEFHGLEIWNYMSEFKSYIRNRAAALFYAFLPRLAITGPYRETLDRWDQLMAKRSVTGIGGSDAHGTEYTMGPLRRRVFGYAHLFGAINTHVLVPSAWSGEADRDAKLIYAALRGGKAFVGYDALGSTKGFRFTALHRDVHYVIGDTVQATDPVCFCVEVPSRARIRLMLDGRCVVGSKGVSLNHETRTPGVYRVEAHRRYAHRQRGWIYSNAIRVVAKGSRPPV